MDRLIALGVAVQLASTASAADRFDPRRGQAQRLVAEGRCPAALEVLAELRRSDPNDGEVRLQLAIALYHGEDFAASSVELETAAQTLGDERAEIALYRGLLLLTQPEPKSAAAGAAWLERARTLGGEAVEPVASYYAGMGWSTAQDRGRASLSLLRQWADAGSSELFTRYWHDDYLKISGDVPGPEPGVPYPSCAPPADPQAFCGPPGLDEHEARNRDGNGTTIGFLHSMRIPVELPFGDATARRGYQYDRFVARGTEYTYQAHAVAGRIRVGLPWSAALDVSGAWAYRPYRHPSTFPNQPLIENTEYMLPATRHRETSYAVDVVVERPITTWLSASARWHLERTRSTAEVFDYHRQIVGAYLTATLGN